MNTRSVQIITPHFYPVTAGIETNILETYSILAKKGWRVTVHTSRDTLSEKNVLSTYGEIRGIRIIRYHFLNRFGFFPKFNWETTGFVCMHGFDVFPYFYILFYSLILKIIGKKNFALLLIPHGFLTPDWNIFPKSRVILRRLTYKIISKFLINFVVDGIRAVSDWENAELKKVGIKASLIETIPNGLEETAFMAIDKKASTEIKNKVRDLGKYIIQVGRIEPVKNYETTIKALKKIPEDITFVVVGPLQDKQYKEMLDLIINNLGLEKRVVFLGVIRGIDKYYLIKNAQIMVHMSHWEAGCNVIHEGMSQGLVCIVADNAGLSYQIKNGVNGYCLSADDSDALAKKISYVLENKGSNAIKVMGDKNVRYVAGYTWNKVAEKLANFYESTLPGRRYL